MIQTFYQLWIHNIAEDVRAHNCMGVLEHIGKHCGPDLDRYMAMDATQDQWRNWSASMHNLLAIFDAVMLESTPTERERIDQLMRHWIAHQDTRTPPPYPFDHPYFDERK